MRKTIIATTALFFLSPISAQPPGPAILPFTELCVTKQAMSLLEDPSTRHQSIHIDAAGGFRYEVRVQDHPGEAAVRRLFEWQLNQEQRAGLVRALANASLLGENDMPYQRFLGAPSAASYFGIRVMRGPKMQRIEYLRTKNRSSDGENIVEDAGATPEQLQERNRRVQALVSMEQWFAALLKGEMHPSSDLSPVCMPPAE